MSQFLFVLGRTPELAYLELCSYIPEATRISPHLSLVESSDKSRLLSIFQKLGGSIKVAQVLGREHDLLAERLALYLIDDFTQKLTFGISSYDKTFSRVETLLYEIKKILETKGIAARFITPKAADVLSSVVVTEQHITELLVGKEKDTFIIAKTIDTQRYSEWNSRDYDRPCADPQAGMLPPKVARMIVNIANSSPGRSPSATFQVGFDSWKVERVLLDPFCGMGTILAEALLSGWHVLGSDQSDEAVSKAKKNLEWLTSKYQAIDTTSYTLFTSDATHVSEHVQRESVDAIVTEPFMGSTRFGGNLHRRQAGDHPSAGGPRSNDQIHNIKNTIKGLEKLYIGCLKDWHGVLRPRGIVIISFPEFVAGGREFFVKKVIDMCENLGYTVEQGPIEYSRPQAVVRRKFYILRKI